MATLRRRGRPVSMIDSDEDDLGLDSPIMMRRPVVSSYSRRPMSLYSTLDDYDDEYDSPPVTRRPISPAYRPRSSASQLAPSLYPSTYLPDSPQLAVRRAFSSRPEPVSTYVPRSPAYYDSDEDEGTGYLDPLDRDILAWERKFQPFSTSLQARGPQLGRDRAPVIKMIDPEEDYDEALIQRSRKARLPGEPTNVRPWRLRIPKFVPTKELRPPQPTPEVRTYRKPRTIPVLDQVLINYHVSRGRVPKDSSSKVLKENQPPVREVTRETRPAPKEVVDSSVIASKEVEEASESP